jgi:hypothetical protein
VAVVNWSLDSLRSALRRACQCQHIRNSTAGRQQVLALPRAWVLTVIESVAAEVLDLSDEFEYRGFLELAEMLDADLVQRVAAVGLGSSNPEVQEAAEDFRLE